MIDGSLILLFGQIPSQVYNPDIFYLDLHINQGEDKELLVERTVEKDLLVAQMNESDKFIKQIKEFPNVER